MRPGGEYACVWTRVVSAEEGNFAVWLTRIEGKLDLSSLRHNQTDERLNNHEQRLHRHSNDISNLQAANLVRETERKTLAWGSKAIWTCVGAIPMGAIVAGLMKLLGS